MPQTLKYPLDVDTDRTHLSITAFEYKLPTLQERDSIGRPAVTNNNQVGTSGAGSPVTTTTAEDGSTTQTTTTGAASTGSSPFGIPTEQVQRIIAADTFEDNVVEAPSDAVLGPSLFTVLTYIPSGFGDSVSATWADETVALVGNPAAVKVGKDQLMGLIKPGDSDAGGLAQAIGGAINAIALNKFEQATSSGPLAAARVTLEAAIGRRVVPNTAKVFKGADGISLPLNLIMTPRNSKEGKEMIGIVDLFRQSTIPFIDPTETVPFQNVGLIQFFKYPPIFNITVVPGGVSSVSSGQFFEYRAMALTSFSVAYADNTAVYTYFTDNVPTRATLSLQFNSIFPVFRTSAPISGGV